MIIQIVFLLINVLQLNPSSDISVQPVQDPYKLDISILHLSGNNYDLNIDVFLNEGAWLAGPLKNEYWKGKFDLQLNDNHFILLNEDISVNPPQVETVDQFEKKQMFVINTDSKIKYTFEINNTEDFEVYGTIQFVIEPNCTMETIPFSISQIDRIPKFIFAE